MTINKFAGKIPVSNTFNSVKQHEAGEFYWI
jgi:hypothetical protein